ncbi:MAG: threonyl-tRNA synthetase editing domain-containing protein [Candidatus Aenigmarchaeota archaeon]|nr:threonyl-tRNA synthetase editing domain-containing protein [Candidatus Aenigmarchaeota archaeon]
MKLLQWHCEYFKYKATKLALKTELEPASEGSFENVVVLLVCVEKGDIAETARNAIIAIKPNFDQVKAKQLLIYPYAHLSKNLATPSIALTILKEMENYAKEKGFEVYRAPFGWYKEFECKVYGHPLAELSKTIS